MTKAIFWIGGVMGALFIIFLLTAPATEEVARNNTPSADLSSPQSTQTPEPIAQDEAKPLFIGDPNAPVTIVEYGDFKCPSCNQFHQTTAKQLKAEYIDEGLVNIEFRNLPFIGPDSGLAARGTYCADQQGSFTAYHDALYDYLWEAHYSSGDYAKEFDDIYTVEKIIEVAGSSVADADALSSCLATNDVDSYVTADTKQAQVDGVSGTPGFVFNGQPINGPLSFATFKTLIDSQL